VPDVPAAGCLLPPGAAGPAVPPEPYESLPKRFVWPPAGERSAIHKPERFVRVLTRLAVKRFLSLSRPGPDYPSLQSVVQATKPITVGLIIRSSESQS
jgi:hypothetical protein